MEDWENVDLKTPDGETLKCFLLKPHEEQASGFTVIFFHGNAGNIVGFVPIFWGCWVGLLTGLIYVLEREEGRLKFAGIWRNGGEGKAYMQTPGFTDIHV